MKNIPTIVFLFFVVVCLNAPKAHAGWLEFFFPSLRTVEPDPSDTLQAPFADLEAQKTKKIDKGVLPENALPLDQAHRDDASISEWLLIAVSDSMMFKAGQLDKELAAHNVYFDETGRQEYLNFLNEKGLLPPLQSGRIGYNSIAQEKPMILNKGVVGGAYRWLFEVPVMITIIDESQPINPKAKPDNRRYIIRAQVGRVDATIKTPADAGVLIEHWEVATKQSAVTKQ